ncbi:MAG: SDR family oxidoreductase [Bacillota bacterium]|nr:SDR family oxidoreductase [Bacillota bacterium]
MDLGGKIALVTGGSRGIGRAISILLAEKGANVIINYSKDEKALLETVKIINGAGGYVESIKADISNYEDVKKMIDQIINKFGKLDILVNNAGISKIGLFSDMSYEEYNSLININLIGTLNCSHCAVKYMIRQKSGSIINISSIWGNAGASCEAIYSASKGAINSFTKSLAKELGPSNIKVNAIAPGVIQTEMNNWLTNEEKQDLENEIPLMHFGSPFDVAELAVFLASDSSKYITGQIITVDGGMI